MARPIPTLPRGQTSTLPQLIDWAVKLTQALRERFAPEDTIPEVAAVAPESFPIGAAVVWSSTIAVPAGWVATANPGVVVLRADHPELFTLWGTLYNTGSETGLQFRLLGLASGTGYIWIIRG